MDSYFVKFWLLIGLFLYSCKSKIDVELFGRQQKSIEGGTSEGSNFLIPKQYVFTGIESQVNGPIGGLSSSDNFGIGVINEFYPSYKAPRSAKPFNHQITLTRGEETLNIPIGVIGFDEKFDASPPLGYCDSNSTQALTETANGDLFLGTIVIDAPGWEWWAIFRSTDNGASWERMEKFVGYGEKVEGETHLMDMASKNNDIYACGYGWYNEDINNGTDWIVRKSSDRGVTWSNVDFYREIDDGRDYICYTIEVAPNGDIIAGGTDAMGTGLLRASSDDGATWNEIAAFTDIPNFRVHQIDTSPDGSIWLVGEGSTMVFRKGTYSLGVWSWTSPYDFNFNASSFIYQQDMDLRVLDDNTAFITTGESGDGVIFRTTDGGNTWTEVHREADFRGDNILFLGNGNILVSLSKRSPFPSKLKVLKSTDGGTTWSDAVNFDPAESGYGIFLEQTNSGRILASLTDGDNQSAIYASDDNGLNWNGLSYAVNLERIYTNFNDFESDAAGNYYTTSSQCATADGIMTPPHVPESKAVLMRSTNQGQSWSDISIFRSPDNSTGLDISSDKNGNVYFIGKNNTSFFFHYSQDNGNSWNTHVYPESVSRVKMTVSKSENAVYFFGSNTNTVLKRATDSGTTVTNVGTMAEPAGFDDYNANDIYAVSGDRLIGLVHANEIATGEKFIIVSISDDEGTTWTDSLQFPASASWKSHRVQELSDGRIFLRTYDNQFYFSEDRGVTWSQNTSLSNESDFSIFTKDGNLLFADRGEMVVYKKSDITDSLQKVWDFNDTGDYWIQKDFSLFECSISAYGVCAHVRRTTIVDGDIDEIYPLENADGALPRVDPTGVTKTASSATSITFNWRDANPDSSGYLLVVSQGHEKPSGCNDPTAINIGNVLSHTLSGLEPAQTYSIRICSYNASGVISLGNVIKFNTASSVNEVTELLALPEKDAMELSWVPALDATGYLIAYDTSGSLPFDCSYGEVIDVGNVTNYKVSNLLMEYNYFFRVCAYSSVGDISLVEKVSRSTLPIGWNLQSFIKPPFLSNRLYFGHRTASHKDLLVVGVPDEDSSQNTIINGEGGSSDTGANGSGAVFVYRRFGKLWVQEAYIKAVNSQSGDTFGFSVDVYDDTIVVGAVNEDSNQNTITNGSTASNDESSSSSGAVYVYRYSGGLWGQEAYLKASNANAGDSFGSRVKIFGDLIAVVASNESSNQANITNGASASVDNSASNSGAVYIFKRNLTTWSQEAYIKPSNARADGYFGISLDLDSDTLAVGMARDSSNLTTITNGSPASNDLSSPSSGAVFIFRRNPTSNTWSEESYIKAFNAESNDLFGYSLDLEGNLLAVGAPYESSSLVGVNMGTPLSNNDTADSGAVYTYRRTGAIWSHEAFIKTSTPFSNDTFGRNLALSGDRLLILKNYEGSGVKEFYFSNGIWSSTGEYSWPKIFIDFFPNDRFSKDLEMLSFSGSYSMIGYRNDRRSSAIITPYEIPPYTGYNFSTNKSGAVYVRINNRDLYSPSDVHAKVIETDRIELEWEANLGENATGIKVVYREGSVAPVDCNTGTQFSLGVVNELDVTGLSSGTEYTFRLCGVSDFGESDGSIFSFTTL